MFLLRNKNNNFQLPTLIWGPVPKSCTLAQFIYFFALGATLSSADNLDSQFLIHIIIKTNTEGISMSFTFATFIFNQIQVVIVTNQKIQTLVKVRVQGHQSKRSRY